MCLESHTAMKIDRTNVVCHILVVNKVQVLVLCLNDARTGCARDLKVPILQSDCLSSSFPTVRLHRRSVLVSREQQNLLDLGALKRKLGYISPTYLPVRVIQVLTTTCHLQHARRRKCA